MMHKPHVKKFIEEKKKEVKEKIEKDFEMTLEWKLKKLKTIITTYIPDNEEIESKLTTLEAKVVISAIAELNKVQGDYAPEKHMNVNANLNLEIEELAKLIPIYQKEY